MSVLVPIKINNYSIPSLFNGLSDHAAQLVMIKTLIFKCKIIIFTLLGT
jgi:hypothetical protein